EVIREALRFMERNEELIYQMNLDRLRTKLAEGERDMEEGRFKELSSEQIGPLPFGSWRCGRSSGSA
ncbi:MAG: hypothetical protein ACREV4_06300, partial [Gammaproteobacteria bacterium]